MAAIPLKQILKARTIEGEIYDRLEGDRVRCYACGHRCLILPGLDGICREWAIETVAVPGGSVSPNDQMGWSPLGAAIVTRMREPAR